MNVEWIIVGTNYVSASNSISSHTAVTDVQLDCNTGLVQQYTHWNKMAVLAVFVTEVETARSVEGRPPRQSCHVN